MRVRESVREREIEREFVCVYVRVFVYVYTHPDNADQTCDKHDSVSSQT